jgi:hypothetical protein
MQMSEWGGALIWCSVEPAARHRRTAPTLHHQIKPRKVHSLKTKPTSLAIFEKARTSRGGFNESRAGNQRKPRKARREKEFPR